MHRMTRDARGTEVRAPFDGTRFGFHGDAVVLEQRGDERFMRLERGDGSGATTYRVTRVIGGRTREDFAGVDVAGGHEEVVLPVSFVYATRALRYKGYSVMVHERATLRPGPVWSRACVFCHNTVPEIDRLLGAIAEPRARPYQSQEVDRWLPVQRRARVRVTDGDAFADAVRSEIDRLGGTLTPGPDARAMARAAIEVVRPRFDGSSLVEEGIGCEACHGGSLEHARNPGVHPSLAPTAPWLDVTYPQDAPAQRESRVCARCHQVLFSRYPFTWEGGRRDANAGGSHINSGEGRDFLLGGCSTRMACSTCHDPHGGDAPAAMAALGTPAGNATCTSCHTQLADRARLRDHAHHDPAGPGGACIACHMPRKNMGLDGKLTRYHRIGSPTDPARVLGDRPLECALCHADATVRGLVDKMEAWWPVRYPRQRLEELYGSLDANVLRATLERGRAHEQGTAIGALAEAQARDAAPLLEKQLANEYPLVREWAERALRELGVPVRASPPLAPGAVDEDAED
jgi:predicted CXXCH cytochrome family protein